MNNSSFTKENAKPDENKGNKEDGSSQLLKNSEDTSLEDQETSSEPPLKKIRLDNRTGAKCVPGGAVDPGRVMNE